MRTIGIALVGMLALLLGSCNDGGDDDTDPPAGDDDATAGDDDGGDDDVGDDDATGVEVCDGLDNDGDGVADDGFECVLGVVEPCDGGVCEDAQVCEAGCTWSECAPHCAKDETCCPGGCVDLTHDVDNCGACERACTEELWGNPPECFGGGCCLKGCRNGSEICDDERFTVPSPYVRMFLVCYNDNGGVAYLAPNTGPDCDDGVPRCRGWEENGMNAWDHLKYITQMDCTTAGEYREIDLSAHEGEGMYIGVHDQPEGGGDMTAVCVAEGA